MNSECTDLKTLQDVAAAQARGDEITFITDAGNYKYEQFKPWMPSFGWFPTYEFRSRPAKKTKTIVLREALINPYGKVYCTSWVDKPPHNFVKWLDTPERIVEIEQ